MLIVFGKFIFFVYICSKNYGLLRKRQWQSHPKITNNMNKIILLLLEMLKTAKTKLGRIILIVLIVLGLVYLCFATSCCSVSSSTTFSVDSAKVHHLNYHKNDTIKFQKLF